MEPRVINLCVYSRENSTPQPQKPPTTTKPLKTPMATATPQRRGPTISTTVGALLSGPSLAALDVSPRGRAYPRWVGDKKQKAFLDNERSQTRNAHRSQVSLAHIPSEDPDVLSQMGLSPVKRNPSHIPVGVHDGSSVSRNRSPFTPSCVLAALHTKLGKEGS
jgi:hypothetical protein